ncbi:hypothetical protein KP78_32480 [Jeotgalibacillus soli]|uniref:Uncharacterized protein n=1 Tax=Jeotgalibacillus soli TaxID=889306 RepID=A0A0C2RR96_9BACL|nr:hypothetical protein KP78_32480 [Jeotgalibacillus soli]
MGIVAYDLGGLSVGAGKVKAHNFAGSEHLQAVREICRPSPK